MRASPKAATTSGPGQQRASRPSAGTQGSPEPEIQPSAPADSGEPALRTVAAPDLCCGSSHAPAVRLAAPKETEKRLHQMVTLTNSSRSVPAGMTYR